MAAGRFLCVFFFATGSAGATFGVGVGAAVVLAASGLEMPTSAVLGVSFEQALSAIRIPRMTNPAIIAIFCWRDQDVSVAPELLLLVLWGNFSKFVIVSPPLLNADASDRAGQRPSSRVLIRWDLRPEAALGAWFQRTH